MTIPFLIKKFVVSISSLGHIKICLISGPLDSSRKGGIRCFRFTRRVIFIIVLIAVAFGVFHFINDATENDAVDIVDTFFKVSQSLTAGFAHAGD